MDEKTTGILTTGCLAVLCGVPGCMITLFGVFGAAEVEGFGASLERAYGSELPMRSIGWALLAVGLVVVAVPLVAALLTLRKRAASK
jgi:hypothetical protein